MARRTENLPYAASKLKAPIKIPGGKWYLVRRILSLAPPNTTRFLDLYGGSGVMTLNAPRTWARHYNDADAEKYNVLRVMQDPHLCTILRMHLFQTQYSEATFNEWLNRVPQEPAERAAKEIILRRMSRGGSKKSFAWSERLRGGQPGDKNAWENFLREIVPIHDGLQGSMLTCLPALHAMRPYKFDWQTCLYADPPYMHSTRVTTDLYDEHEMTEADHEAMAVELNDCTCRVILSGYRNPHYDQWFSHWRRIDIDIANHQSQAKTKQRKIESIWLNFD